MDNNKYHGTYNYTAYSYLFNKLKNDFYIAKIDVHLDEMQKDSCSITESESDEEARQFQNKGDKISKQDEEIDIEQCHGI